MKIGIVGGGAIGLLFAAYLTENHEVTIYTRTNKQAEILSKKGITVMKDNAIVADRPVQAKSFPQWCGDTDMTIITVKQYDVAEVVDRMAHQATSHGSCLLFVQNGMGHLALLDMLGNEDIVIGTVEHGALRLNEHTVDHTGEGITRLASYRGSDFRLKQLMTHSQSEFPFVKEADYEQMLIKKLLVNVMINPLTAILRVKNGELIENDYYFELFTLLFKELQEVFGFADDGDIFDHVVDICKKTANNQSSMLKDVLEGRQTEVDAIVGYVNAVAKGRQVTTPLIQTLYLLVKGIELQKGAP